VDLFIAERSSWLQVSLSVIADFEMPVCKTRTSAAFEPGDDGDSDYDRGDGCWRCIMDPGRYTIKMRVVYIAAAQSDALIEGDYSKSETSVHNASWISLNFLDQSGMSGL
jgi:hypothetical protein